MKQYGFFSLSLIPVGAPDDRTSEMETLSLTAQTSNIPVS